MAELTGKRALVPGASGGIGASIARELHRRGATLVLTARRRTALQEVAAQCGGAEIITAELGRGEEAAQLWREASRKPIDILVNNAGFGYFRAFASIEAEREAELIQLNITSLVELSRAFVAYRRGQAGRAYLLNVGSIAAYQSTPNMAIYAASKAFVRNFTEALHDELAGSPVSATCLSPGGTHTNFHAMAGAGDYGWIANRSMLSADAVAVAGVRAMLVGKRNVIPGLLNKLSCWGVRLVPRWFASWMSRRVLGKPRAGELPSRLSA